MGTKRFLLTSLMLTVTIDLYAQASIVANQSAFDYPLSGSYGTVITHAQMHPTGNYCVAGYTLEGQGKYFVALRSRYGSAVWVHQVWPQMTVISDLKVRPDGTIYALGYKDTGTRDTVMIKLSSSGSEMYNLTSNFTTVGNVNDQGLKLKLHANGAYIAGTARRKGNGLGRNGFFLANYNDKGRLFTVWTRHSYWSSDASYDGRIQIHDIGINQVGEVTVAGRITVHPITNENKAFVWRFNSDGGLLSESLIDLGTKTSMSIAKVMQDGSSMYAGTVPDGGNSKRFLSNISTDGNLKWFVTGAPLGSKTFGNYLDFDSSNNVYLGGTRLTNGVSVGTLEKFSPMGIPIWTKDTDVPVSKVVVDALQEVYTLSGVSQTELFATKFSSTGVKRLSQSLVLPVGNLLLGSNHFLVPHLPSGDIGVLCSSYTLVPEYYKGRAFTVRQAAVPIADGYIMQKNSVLLNKLVVTNDRFASGGSASLVTQPTVGSITFGANGLFSYTPPTNFTGIVTFTYRLSKPGVTANTAKVTIDVRP